VKLTPEMFSLGGLSRNQKKILELLEIKPEMTTKEIAEMIFGRIITYESQEYASVHRSLMSLERQACIRRVQIQLRWRLATKNTTKNELEEEPSMSKS
jgi:hypothetical protein